ncbi:MAG: VWA domain-containing protein [Ignavibacteria bacterium]|nr:VWA domain-containing protein [Ignavibacteria bacterium]
MKTLLLLVGMLFCAISATAQYNQSITPNLGEDWSGSPRLLVQNGNAENVELASTTVTGAIVGVIADINIRQVYVNHGTKPIEAVYVFPGSTRAAVYAMTMTVGNHIIRSVIREKEQARREYTAAKSQGRSASLLEMLKPNIFRMNVANVRPGDSIVIDMRYTEAIYLSENVYEFVYPAVVAPRYVGAVQTEVDAALSGKELPTEIPGKFFISLRLATGVMLKGIYSPSHDLDVDNGNVYTKKNIKMNLVSHCKVGISARDSVKQNRDFVLRYSLSGRAIESGLLLYKGETENYFMLMAQPPRNVEIPSILPREFVFIVDVSGSMHGTPLAIADRLMRNLFNTLRPQDKFNIMTFSGGSQVLADESLEATEENIRRGLAFQLQNSHYGGGTELLPALKRALAMPADEKCSRSFVVITDGFVDIEREAFKLVRENLNEANIYAFGIGSSVNRYLMEGLARAGNADPMIITNMNEASTMADKFKHYIEAPVLTNIKVDYGNLDVYDVEPASIPDVTAQRPVIVFGKWRGKPYGTVTLTGTTADSTIDISMNIGALPMIAAHSALKYLWARNKIMMIEDESNQYPTDEERKIITNIGLQYNLLTRYTSFVAVDSLTPVVAVRKIIPPRDTARATTATKKIASDTLSLSSTDSEKLKRPRRWIATDSMSNKTNSKSAPKSVLVPNVTDTKLNFPIDGDTTTNLSLSPSMTRPTNRGDAPALKVEKSGIPLSSNGLTVTLPEASATSKNKDAKQSATPSTTKPGKSSSSKKETKESRVKEPRPTVAAVVPISKDSRTQDTSSLQVATSDSISVQSGLGEVVPQGGISNDGARPAETNIRVQGTELTDRVSSGSGGIRTTPSITEYSSGDEELDAAADPLNPGKKKPRIYGGIITALTFGTLGNYEPNSLTGNVLTGISNESKFGYSTGIRLEYLLGDVKNSRSSITADVMFGRLGFLYSAQDSVLSMTSEKMPSQYRLATSASAFTLNSLYNARIIRGTFLGISVGITTSYIFNVEHSYSVSAGKVILPSATTISISDSGRTMQYTDASTSSVNRLQFGLVGGLHYQFLLGRAVLSPFIQYEYGLNGILSGGKERMQVFRAGCVVIFAL